MDGMSLPPGFRFSPTDIELVLFFLKRKVMGKKFRFEAITEVDVYKFSPSDLPGQSCLRTRDLEWYFFCPRNRANNNTVRTNRATDNGYWKTTGNDRPIVQGSQVIGMKKTLIFHYGRAPSGVRTNWVMHEYRLKEECIDACFSKDAYVLCKIFEKSGLGPKNGEQHGAPFREEDWDDDADDCSAVFTGAISSTNLLNHRSHLTSIPLVSSAIVEDSPAVEDLNFATDEGSSLLNIRPEHMGYRGAVLDFPETRDVENMSSDFGHDDIDCPFPLQQMSSNMERPGVPPLSIYERILLEGNPCGDFQIHNDRNDLSFKQNVQGVRQLFPLQEHPGVPPLSIYESILLEGNPCGDFQIHNDLNGLSFEQNVQLLSPLQEHPGVPPLSIYESILLEGNPCGDFQIYNDLNGLSSEQNIQGVQQSLSPLQEHPGMPSLSIYESILFEGHAYDDFRVYNGLNNLVSKKNVLGAQQSLSRLHEHPGVPSFSIYESTLLEGRAHDDFGVSNDFNDFPFEQNVHEVHQMYSKELENELQHVLVNNDVESEMDVFLPQREINHLNFPIESCHADLVTSSNALPDSHAFEFGYNEEIDMPYSFSTAASEESYMPP